MSYQYRPPEGEKPFTPKPKMDAFAAMIFWIVAAISAGAFMFQVSIHGLLPTRYRLILLGILALFLLAVGLVIFGKNLKHKKRYGSMVLLGFFIAFTLLANWYLFTGFGTLGRITAAQSDQVVDFSFVTHKESPIQHTSQLNSTKVLAALTQDAELLVDYLPQIEEEWNADLNFEDTGDYLAGAKRLLEDKKEPLLLNEAYRSLVEEQYPNFFNETTVVSRESLTIKNEEAEVTEVEVVQKNDSFVAYISGIDTQGPVSTISRSDVNIVMAVNPNTREILMLSIPRDTYVPIAGGGNDQYDKLTHAGIYGISSSVETLENLLDVDINYHAKVNFTSLVRMVDVLGGIEVDNPRYFSGGGYEFPEGINYLEGEEALAFSRERYQLADGDVGRGANHLRVIQAMINKAISPSILLNYNSVLSVAEEAMETNMPKKKIVELINDQIDRNDRWAFKNTELSGYGTMGSPSYAMPGYELYMYELYDESVDEVQKTFKDFLDAR